MCFHQLKRLVPVVTAFTIILMLGRVHAAWGPIDTPLDDIEVNEQTNVFDTFKVFFRDLDGIEVAGGGANTIDVPKNGWDLISQFTQAIDPWDKLFINHTLFHEVDDLPNHSHPQGPNFVITISTPGPSTVRINGVLRNSLTLPHNGHFDKVTVTGTTILSPADILDVISWTHNIDARHVPEPTTLALAGLGLSLIAMRRRR